MDAHACDAKKTEAVIKFFQRLLIHTQSVTF